MPVSKALRQLLAVRESGEDNARAVLQSAIAALHEHEAILAHNVLRAHEAPKLVVAGIVASDLCDRTVGVTEQMIAAQRASKLQARVEDERARVETLRQEYLAARTNRHQAQTLIDETIARDEQEERRKSQKNLDDWHRDSSRRSGA